MHHISSITRSSFNFPHAEIWLLHSISVCIYVWSACPQCCFFRFCNILSIMRSLRSSGFRYSLLEQFYKLGYSTLVTPAWNWCFISFLFLVLFPLMLLNTAITSVGSVSIWQYTSFQCFTANNFISMQLWRCLQHHFSPISIQLEAKNK